MITIHTLAYGELYYDVLAAVAQFLSTQSVSGFFRIAALLGIIVSAVQFSKSRSPLVFVKWWFAYVLCANVILLPKTTVLIEDLSVQSPTQVENVPVVLAIVTSVATALGFGLAESYDAIFTSTRNTSFTKNGLLLESRLIHALKDFKIHELSLQESLDHYFRSCIVGDIRLNQKYRWMDLELAPQLYSFLEQNASPLRMISVSMRFITCKEALKVGVEDGLRKALEAEVEAFKSTWPAQFFDKQIALTIETYFGVKETNEAIVLQLFLMHALQYGMQHYQAFADNVTFNPYRENKTHASFAHMSQSLINGLPLLHALLVLLLIGLFPLVLACVMIPGCEVMRKTYLQLFISIHCWPLLFAILNDCLSRYGMHYGTTTGGLNIHNLTIIAETHDTLLTVAGCMSLAIPFLAHKLVFAFAHEKRLD